MITMFDEEARAAVRTGCAPDVVAAQAERLGLRQVTSRCTWPTYDAAFAAALDDVAADGVTHVVFGDITVPRASPVGREHLRTSRGSTAVEPLFGASTRDLFLEWVASGAEAVIVTSRAERLDRCWLGRTLSIDMLGDFDRLAVDPCGENGEYHTVVTNSPLFREPLRLEFGEQVSRSGCWALDVAVAAGATVWPRGAMFGARQVQQLHGV